jgi:alpha-glucosidase
MPNTTLPPAWLRCALHFPTRDYLSNPYPALGETITIRLRAPESAPIEQVVLRTFPNGEQQLTTLQPEHEEEGWRWWSAKLAVLENRVPYRFAIQTKEAVWWLNAAGVSQSLPFELFDFKLLADTPPIPWLQQAVFYQIFPDRFANGDPNNDPQQEALPYQNWHRQTFPWGQPAPHEPGLLPFYGGDLPGILQHIDYLEQLGVNSLYLNPIFTAFTNHRYDVCDYFHVDPVVGGDEALVDLAQALHERGMRYILDIVPNHCGIGHPWFQKARQDPSSQEAQYFFIDHAAERYESWLGFGSLPKLNYRAPELCKLMFAGEQSAFRYWLRPPFEADGWRVDAGNMLARQNDQQLGHTIIPQIRQSVKQTKPEAYLMAENFFEAISQLQGDQWDGVMNYFGFYNPLFFWLKPFSQNAVGWKGKLTAEQPWPTEIVLKAWGENLAAIPWAIALQQFNIIDSHDVPRALTALGGDKQLLRLAAVVQFTFPGVPCLYYGDEIGLENAESFGSRNCFPWDESTWDQDLLNFYRQLIALRKRSPVLAEGAFQVLYGNEDMLLYQRVLGDEHILVSANRSHKTLLPQTLHLPQAALPTSAIYEGFFSGAKAHSQGSKLEIPEIPPGAEIWLQQS